MKTKNYQSVFNYWVTVCGEEVLSGELLRDTGHELVCTRIGDPVPPNAVIANVSNFDGNTLPWKGWREQAPMVTELSIFVSTQLGSNR